MAIGFPIGHMLEILLCFLHDVCLPVVYIIQRGVAMDRV